MYQTRKKIVYLVIDVVVLLLSVMLSIILLSTASESSVSPVVTIGIPALVFVCILLAGTLIRKSINRNLRKKLIESGNTKLFGDFIDKLRFCYSLDDLYQEIQDILELKADCAVLFVDCEKNYVLYNSPDRISSYYTVRDKLALNFPSSWEDGVFFLGDNLGIVSSYKEARGFFLSFNQKHFYVFCRYICHFDTEIYSKLYEEFVRFSQRIETLNSLAEISTLTKEWEQLAETQVSFLPRQMPVIDKLKFAAYYRPLVNVSGDYYTVLPITPTKTLLMLGDVSGKGLPAALIMGLVMNTVKVMQNKEDLVGLISGVDKAIKNMHLQDKYTVLFIGIVDTERMKFTYVNASMSDPKILTRGPDGYRIKELQSTASLVGIIDMGDVHIAEQRLFRGDMILLASDGVSEVMDENGVELGDTELFTNTLKASASKQPQQFVNDIVDLIFQYNGDKRLHDDVTMLVAKVG